jgi:hypothetical protein
MVGDRGDVMTFLQNQGSDVRANVLHDQGVPNTLQGVPLPVGGRDLLRPIGYALALVLIPVAVAFLVVRPT